MTSKITRHTSSAEMAKGETEDVIISSEGKIELGRSARVIAEKLEDVWSINSIVVSGGTVYFGTSPNGGIYRYELGKLTKIYPEDKGKAQADTSAVEDKGAAKVGEEANSIKPGGGGKAVGRDKYLTNEHIFAMSTDLAGRVLAGISGDKCRLCRIEGGKIETVFEPNDTKYIFAIVTDREGSIYLGTGPAGKIYKLDSFGGKPWVVYRSREKNIL